MKIFPAFVLLLLSLPLSAETTTYRVLVGGLDTGHMIVDRNASTLDIDFDFKQNGRGPTIVEKLTLDQRGYPTDWTISGTTTFGSQVNEYFQFADGEAKWEDTTGSSTVATEGEALFYIDQNGSAYSRGLLVRALLGRPNHSMTVYPGGEASLQTRATMSFSSADGHESQVTAYELLGLSLNPQLVLLDENQEFFAVASPRFSIVREGFEAADEALRHYAEQLSTDRFVDIQAEVANEYDAPVRIRNVRIFDPERLRLGDLKDVIVYGNRISSVQPAGSAASEGEVAIEGAGGTLVPGMYEMHGHIGQGNALLNIAAGVTSVRDMGNENAVLESLIGRINSGEIAGPRITRSCFIEGKSEFSAATGETVATLQEGLDMVRWCGARDFHQVKLYNSMRPEWAETLVEEAHNLGMRVAGHVPAFSSANEMIEAGFDEITHANQLLLGWVLNEGEDTRTLFRFTAMKRFPNLDLDGEDVQFTVGRMLKKDVAHDPTLAIHEHGLTGVDGEVAPMAREIIDHLPTNEQRSYKSALFGADTQAERDEYIAAFDFIMKTMTKLHNDGVFLVPGTDLGGSFSYHRELELFEQVGLTRAEVLRRATLDMATYLGQDEDLGSIEKGKYADFFLVPGDPTADLSQLRKIQMVVSDGVVYFPSDIYPAFGIRPFVDAPTVSVSGPN